MTVTMDLDLLLDDLGELTTLLATGQPPALTAEKWSGSVNFLP